MRLTDKVDIPIEVIESLENGNLVFFVGAGASMSSPSDMPDFNRLVANIAEKAQAEPRSEEIAHDYYLGDLERLGVDVNSFAAEELKQISGEPNRNHQAIVKLAHNSRRPKIITTNFDLLLNRAWNRNFERVNEWVGPALPLGDDFEGIVQLHGSLEGRVEDLVLTDRSFGATYLTKGWATRFLLDAFRENTVLFIGYSHNDPVMRYVATALSPSSSRYALIGVDEESRESEIRKASALGIHPIPYPKTLGHGVLTEVLEKWADYSEGGWLDKRHRIELLLRSVENLTPPELDMLDRCLSTSDGIETISSICQKLPEGRERACFSWVRDSAVFQSLFSGTESRVSGINLQPLENWVAGYFVRNEATIRDFWDAVSLHGVELTASFYTKLEFFAYRELYESSRPELDILLGFLHTSVPGISAPLDLSQSFSFDQAVERSISPSEISRSLQTRIEPLRSWDVDGDREVRFRVRWALDERTVSEALSQRLKGDGGYFIDAVERAVTEAHAMQAWFSPESCFDQLFGPIPRLGDTIFGIAAALVEYLMGCCRKGITKDRQEKWWQSRVPILQRMALIALECTDDVGAEEKLDWLLGQPIDVLDPVFRAESTALIASIAPHVSDDSRAQIIARILEESGDDLTAFRALRIVSENTPDWRAAEHEIEKLRESSPEVQEALRAWENHPSNEVNFRIAPLSGVDALESFLQQFLTLEKETDSKLDGAIAQYLEENPEDVLRLALAATESKSPLSMDALRSCVRRINSEDLLADPRRLEKLCEASEICEVDHLAIVIAGASGNAEKAETIEAFEAAVESLWRNASADHLPSLIEPDGFACYWPESLVIASITLAKKKWSIADSGPDEASRSLTERLRELTAEESVAPFVIRGISRRLGFISALDSDYVEQDVLPLFEGAKSEYALAGFLLTPQLSRSEPLRTYSHSILSNGWTGLSDLEQLRARFYEIVALVVENQVFSPGEIRSLFERGVVQMDDENRADFVSTMFRFVDEENKEKIWEGGLDTYLRMRLEGKPRSPESEELRAIADLPFVAPELSSKLVPLLSKTPEVMEQKLSKDIPTDFGAVDLSSAESEFLAQYVDTRLQKAGIDQGLEFLLMCAFEMVPEPGPETTRLIQRLKAM